MSYSRFIYSRLSFGFAFVAWLSPAGLFGESLLIHHIGIGQGDSTLIEARHKNQACEEPDDTDCTYILIDTGNSRRKGVAIGNYLAGLGIPRLDMLITSHLHSDHYGGAPTLLAELRAVNFPINYIADRTGARFPRINDLPYETNNEDEFDANDRSPPEPGEPNTGLFNRYIAQVNEYKRTGTQHFVPDLDLEVFQFLKRETVMRFMIVAGLGAVLVEYDVNKITYPEGKRTSENDYSFAWILRFEGFFYFTGGDIGGGGGYLDLETPLSKYFLTWPQQEDFHFCAYKASHHGSGHSSNAAFLAAGKPSFTVVPSALRSFSGTQIPVKRTLENILAQKLPGGTQPAIAYTYTKAGGNMWEGQVNYYQDVILQLDQDPGYDQNITFKALERRREKTNNLPFYGGQAQTSFTCKQPHPAVKELRPFTSVRYPKTNKPGRPTLLQRCLNFLPSIRRN